MDIVERLKKHAYFWREHDDIYAANNFEDAIEEIERLREALREIGESLTPDKYNNEICLETHCGEIARAALKEKEWWI